MNPTNPKGVLPKVQVPQNAGQEGKVLVLEIKQAKTSLPLRQTDIGPSHQRLDLTRISLTPQKVATRCVNPIQNRLGPKKNTHPEISNALDNTSD